LAIGGKNSRAMCRAFGLQPKHPLGFVIHIPLAMPLLFPEAINTASGPAPGRSYNQAVKAERCLFCFPVSRRRADPATGERLGREGMVEAETRQVLLANLRSGCWRRRALQRPARFGDGPGW